MRRKSLLLLGPASLLAGIFFSLAGPEEKSGQSAMPDFDESKRQIQYNQASDRGLARSRGTSLVFSDEKEGRHADSGQRQSSAALFAQAGSAEFFADLPKHGHSHDHGDFVVPEKFEGATLDEWVALLPEEQGERLQRYRNDLASLDPELRRFMCWAPGTPAEIVAGYRQAEVEGGLAPGDVRIAATQFLNPARWTSTATNPSGSSSQGDPITVTWSIAPDGTNVPGGSGSLGPSDFRAWMQGIYGGSTTADPTTQSWFPLMEEAFAHLGGQSGLNFVYEANDTGSSFSRSIDGSLGTRGDIRISARNIDGNSGTLAFAYSPGYGDIVMDSADNFYDNTTSNSRRFVNVLTHEIGHAIGLGHVCPIRETKLMEPFVTEDFRGAQFDDIQSTQRQYGDAFESHDGETDNDLAQRAKDLGLLVDTSYAEEWLSVDDSGDSDWYRFDAPTNSRLTVRLVPASGSYLEGPQTTSCDTGTLFDPAVQQDLTLQVFRSGVVQVATQDAEGPGGGEVIAGLQLSQAGEYQIKVAGKSANAAQLYRLEVLLESAPAGVDLRVVSTRLAGESNVGQNGNVDPDETIQLGVTLINIGSDEAQLIAGELTGPAGFIDFGGLQTVPTIPSGQQAELLFTVSLQGQCGDPVDMTLGLSSNGGTVYHPVGVVLGSAGGDDVTNFDQSTELPAGWVTSQARRGELWEVVGSRKISSPYSAFVSGVSRVGVSNLDSLAMGIGPSGGTLTFRHWYDLQQTYDGGQLHASLDGGDWFNLLDTATATEGGYNRTIVNFGGSVFADEEAWSGNSGGFVRTTVQIPLAWAGSEIQFRWSMASDSSGSSTGWWIDDVEFDTDFVVCDPYLPMVSLFLDEGILSERPSVDPLELRLSTPLPLRYPVDVPLTLSGTAELEDLLGEPIAALAVGESEAIFELGAKLDRLDEGIESLTLTTPATSPDYVLDGETSYTVSVEDSEYSEWSGQEFGPGGLLTEPDDDADGDGWSNVAEYLSGTDPNDPASVPVTQTVFGESTLEIQTGPSVVERGDAEIRGETSTDLQSWTDEDVGKTPNGFEVSRDDPSRFLRLIYEFLDTPEEP
ncbi:matrixin family metalloprotease [Haloferula sp.]|uniref:matrixin family metalloprotease n=1 Tax=Haloferula sp. TaxID=2497595 RepID=UPI00329F5C8B